MFFTLSNWPEFLKNHSRVEEIEKTSPNIQRIFANALSLNRLLRLVAFRKYHQKKLSSFLARHHNLNVHGDEFKSSVAKGKELLGSVYISREPKLKWKQNG